MNTIAILLLVFCLICLIVFVVFVCKVLLIWEQEDQDYRDELKNWSLRYGENYENSDNN